MNEKRRSLFNKNELFVDRKKCHLLSYLMLLIDYSFVAIIRKQQKRKRSSSFFLLEKPKETNRQNLINNVERSNTQYSNTMA